ncbi:MAG: hypothetical protein ACK5A9_06865, partial [Pseudanabaena sp.]
KNKLVAHYELAIADAAFYFSFFPCFCPTAFFDKKIPTFGLTFSSICSLTDISIPSSVFICSASFS